MLGISGHSVQTGRVSTPAALSCAIAQRESAGCQSQASDLYETLPLGALSGEGHWL